MIRLSHLDMPVSRTAGGRGEGEVVVVRQVVVGGRARRGRAGRSHTRSYTDRHTQSARAHTHTHTHTHTRTYACRVQDLEFTLEGLGSRIGP